MDASSSELRLLLLEDTPLDAELVLQELNSALKNFAHRIVYSRDDFLRQLKEFQPHAILSDFAMPQFNAIDAFSLLKSEGSNIPFILVTGSQGEETAVKCIREGMDDYVLKSSLKRLPSALMNALQRKGAERQTEDAIEALMRSEEKYRGLFEGSKDMIFFSSPDGRLIDVNSAGVELFGYGSKQELLNARVQDLYFEPAERASYKGLIERQGYVKDYEIIMKNKAGSKLMVLETAVAVYRPDGKVEGYRGTIRDITEMKLLQNQLLQSQKIETIGRLAGGIAHDFNNILMAIIGYSELLLLKANVEDPGRAEIEEILKAANRGASVTQQLLAFSRQQVLDQKAVDLNDHLKDLTGMLQRLLGDDVRMVLKLTPGLPKVKADSSQLSQVIVNLAVNARDAMPGGGNLIVETGDADLDEEFVRLHLGSTVGRYVELTVSDNGFGMDQATVSRIFEPFFTTKELGQGTGLGLSTVYGIVKQHGGYITVYSEPKLGTTFKVYLRCAEESDATSEKQAKAVEVPRGKETILLVDDNEFVRSSVAALVSGYGYKVITAEDGENALAISEKHEGPIHLLITDMVMPKMVGRELAVLLLQKRPKMKVLYMSGYSQEAIAHQGQFEPGMTFLQKPASGRTIAAKIRELLD